MNGAVGADDLKLVTSDDYYTIWTTLYGTAETPDSERDGDQIVQQFQSCGENWQLLEKRLYQWLLIIQDSSSYAEDFGESEYEVLTRCITNKVPTTLPGRLLGPLTSLLCSSTFGDFDDGNDDMPSDGKKKVNNDRTSGRWPSWLFPLLDACHRCAVSSPRDFGYLQAIDTLLKFRAFRKVTSRFEGIDTIYQAALNIVKSASSLTTAAAAALTSSPPPPRATIYCAINLLVDQMRIYLISSKQQQNSDLEPLITSLFQSLTEFLTIYLNRMSLPSSASHISEQGNAEAVALLLASLKPILTGASVLNALPNGEKDLVGSGFINTMIAFALKHCCKAQRRKPGTPYTPTLEYEALSSIACFVSKLIQPKKIQLSSPETAFENDTDMKQLFDRLRSEYGSLCDAIIELQGDVVIAQALILNESRDHLSSPNSLNLSGLLALLTLSSEEFTVKMIMRLENMEKLTACLQSHANSTIWTYSGSGGRRIMGTTKEGVCAQLILSCALPSHFPPTLIPVIMKDDDDEDGDNLKTSFRGVKAMRKEDDNHGIPSPKDIIKASIRGTRNRIMSKATGFLDDWMLCLAFL